MVMVIETVPRAAKAAGQQGVKSRHATFHFFF